MAKWAVVVSKPSAEELAECCLRAEGWRTYLPRYRKLLRPMVRQQYGGLRRSGKPEVVLRPLFPRYLFVELDLERDQWSGMLRLRGVSSLIWQGGLPALVAGELVDEIKASVHRQAFDDPRCRNDLRPGDAVRIEGGEFGGVIARLVSLDEAGRARVLLDIMGRIGVPATVPADSLVAV